MGAAPDPSWECYILYGMCNIFLKSEKFCPQGFWIRNYEPVASQIIFVSLMKEFQILMLVKADATELDTFVLVSQRKRVLGMTWYFTPLLKVLEGFLPDSDTWGFDLHVQKLRPDNHPGFNVISLVYVCICSACWYVYSVCCAFIFFQLRAFFKLVGLFFMWTDYKTSWRESWDLGMWVQFLEQSVFNLM